MAEWTACQPRIQWAVIDVGSNQLLTTWNFSATGCRLPTCPEDHLPTQTLEVVQQN